MENLKRQLNRAAAEKNRAKRGVKIAAVIAQALREVGQDPILVGGSAVEFYTEGGYATEDIDMIVPGGDALFKTMVSLGFDRRGKDFIHEKLKIYVEFLSVELGDGRQSDILDIDGNTLRIISIEDLIVDRLCAYKFWKSEIDGVAALLLLESEPTDLRRLNSQAIRQDVADALTFLRQLYEDVVRQKLSRQAASDRLKKWLVEK